MQLIPPLQAPPAGSLVLANTADVLSMAEDLHAAPVVVLNFPKWTDGRAYSQAVLLRGRRRYGGEIRASGDVLVDMLPLLRRCGFDSVQLRADQNTETAAHVLGLFPGQYQGDAAGGRPAYAQQAA